MMAQRAGLDRTAVIEAAAHLVDKQGIEHLSLANLAQELGIRTPSLYNHVAGLPGLKRELALYCMRDLRSHITRAVLGKSSDEAVTALFYAYRAYASEKPGRYSLTLQAPDPADREVAEVAQEIVAIAQAVLAVYNLSQENSIHAIRSLRSMVHGFIVLEMAGGFKMPINLDASFSWLITMFITNLHTNCL